jgi:hypothetical protein
MPLYCPNRIIEPQSTTARLCWRAGLALRRKPSQEESMRAFALYCGNTEPSIDELLGDPIMHVLMKRDGVPPRDVRALIAAARRRQRRSAAMQGQIATSAP